MIMARPRPTRQAQIEAVDQSTSRRPSSKIDKPAGVTTSSARSHTKIRMEVWSGAAGEPVQEFRWHAPLAISLAFLNQLVVVEVNSSRIVTSNTP
jgi:hypothetical protein